MVGVILSKLDAQGCLTELAQYFLSASNFEWHSERHLRAKKYCDIPGLECYMLLKCKYGVRQCNKVFCYTNEKQSLPLWKTKKVLRYLPMAQDGINF